MLLQDILAYRGDATGEFQTFLGAIAYDHHFIQTTGIIHKTNLHGFLEVIDIHIKRTVAYILYT